MKDELLNLLGAQYATGEEWRNNSGRMKRLSQSENSTRVWMCLVMKVKSDAVKKHYCIRTCNVSCMNQGKLEVVK